MLFLSACADLALEPLTQPRMPRIYQDTLCNNLKHRYKRVSSLMENIHLSECNFEYYALLCIIRYLWLTIDELISNDVSNYRIRV